VPETDLAPGVNLDDRLRLVAGFSLFRRSSSVVANPTTQGVSLRGLGSSGASRTLVLWNGVPLNDPFGGWIYWTRIAPDEVGRVEISRGASTSLYGDRAMGGVISLFPPEPKPRHFTAEYDFGNRNTNQVSAGYSQLFTHWAGSASARAFTTNGYYIVPEDVRGPVDTPAALEFAAATARADYLGVVDRVYIRTDILAEDRQNGTQLQHNSTSLGAVAGQWDHSFGVQDVALTGHFTTEEFRSTYSAISANRQTERLTSTQHVPAQAGGGSVLWRRGAERWDAFAGADVIRVEGYSLEALSPSGSRIGGGVQLQQGYFGQGDYRVGPVRMFAGARVQVPGTGQVFFSPSGGATATFGRWRVRGSAYRSLRAPTLNELYRDFRTGNVLTRANANLTQEEMWGVETGFDFQTDSARISVTAFRNSLSGLITNVTLSSTPQLIIRQRMNAADAISQGVEVEAQKRWRHWTAEASYILADSRYTTGARVPQVAQNQGSAQLTWARGGTLVSGGIRALSLQFEDDLNQFLLPGFAVWQMYAEQRIHGPLACVFSLENAYNREFSVGYSPTPLIGAPRLWRVGLRWDFDRPRQP
jgi:outer membrane cobalamin receptor